MKGLKRPHNHKDPTNYYSGIPPMFGPCNQNGDPYGLCGLLGPRIWRTPSLGVPLPGVVDQLYLHLPELSFGVHGSYLNLQSAQSNGPVCQNKGDYGIKGSIVFWAILPMLSVLRYWAILLDILEVQVLLATTTCRFPRVRGPL